MIQDPQLIYSTLVHIKQGQTVHMLQIATFWNIYSAYIYMCVKVMKNAPLLQSGESQELLFSNRSPNMKM